MHYDHLLLQMFYANGFNQSKFKKTQQNKMNLTKLT